VRGETTLAVTSSVLHRFKITLLGHRVYEQIARSCYVAMLLPGVRRYAATSSPIAAVLNVAYTPSPHISI